MGKKITPFPKAASPGARPRAVIYARYSDGPNQTDRSVEGQIKDGTECANRRNMDIVGIYVDRKISGRSCANRSDFQRMLRDAESGTFDYVIVWKIDRFGRNREEIALNRYLLKKCNVKVIQSEVDVPDAPEGIILESVLEGLAEYYSVDLGQKIKRGQRDSIAAGRILSVFPLYGYRKDENLHYVIDDTAATVVRLIFQMYADGSMLIDILSYLEENNVRNNQGRPFNHNMLHRMLRNRQYIGEYQFGDNFNVSIPRIIDQELWDSVQDRIEASSHASTAARCAATVEYLLSGLVTCAKCGERYQGESGTGKLGKVYYYYKCSGRKHKRNGCTGATFKKDWLEDFVVKHTVEDILKDDVIKMIVDAVMKYHESDSSTFALRSYEAQVADIDKRLANIMKAIESGIFNDMTQKRVLELQEEKHHLEIQISKEKRKTFHLTQEHVLFWMERFIGGDISDVEYRRELIGSFVNQIVIDDSCIYIAYNLNGYDHAIPYDFITKSCVRPDVGLVDCSYEQSNLLFFVEYSIFVARFQLVS